MLQSEGDARRRAELFAGASLDDRWIERSKRDELEVWFRQASR
jgi:hypothetical protein